MFYLKKIFVITFTVKHCGATEDGLTRKYPTRLKIIFMTNIMPYCEVSKTKKKSLIRYMIMILHQLSIYTSMNHSILQTFETALALQSLDTLSDVRIKVFMLLF